MYKFEIAFGKGNLEVGNLAKIKANMYCWKEYLAI